LRAQFNNTNILKGEKTMNALTKTVLIAILALITAATIVFAGIKNERNVSVNEYFEHPAYEALAKCYQMCPQS
jgi:ABC-type uncharacterized transport system substrate-binding protein